MSTALHAFWVSLRRHAEILLFCFRHCNREKQTNPSPAGFGRLKKSASGFDEAFKIIDADGDGKISPSELCELLRKLGYDESLAMKEAEDMVKEMDSNGDGWVDLAEFVEMMRSADGNRREKDDIIASAFCVYDVNGKGLISAEDLRSVLKRFGFGNFSLEHCKRMIKGVDRDGDGFVNLEEFRSMMMTTSFPT